MESGLVIEDRDLQRYKEELEILLPNQVNGIASEGRLMVCYTYVPNSLNLERLISHEEVDPLTPYWSAWSYQIVQLETRSDVRQFQGKETVKDMCFSRPAIFNGYVEIPIAPCGGLVTDDIDFIQAIETATS